MLASYITWVRSALKITSYELLNPLLNLTQLFLLYFWDISDEKHIFTRKNIEGLEKGIVFLQVYVLNKICLLALRHWST